MMVACGTSDRRFTVMLTYTREHNLSHKRISVLLELGGDSQKKLENYDYTQALADGL